MKKFEVNKSNQMYERAKAVIPNGIYGHFGAAVTKKGPKFFNSSQGAYFWDLDGNKYIDYMCGFGPMILGYNYPSVDKAAKEQYKKGNTVSLANSLMVELAENLVDQITIADWAVFGKNGGDSTSHAVMIARHATGKSKIVKITDGYHGVAPWMQKGNPGTIKNDSRDVLEIPWNDVDSFSELIDSNEDQIACFISSPYHHPAYKDNQLPSEGYWKKMESLCKKHKIIMIIDDVRAGFRVNLSGSNEEFGFNPDLVCFGKAIANGYPLSALVGTKDLFDVAKEVYYSGSHFYNAVPMAAAIQTLKELKDKNVAKALNKKGKRLNEGIVKIAKSHGFELTVSGFPSMPYYRLKQQDMRSHLAWIEECVQRGVYFIGWHNHFISMSHGEKEIEDTLSIVDDAFLAFKKNN